MQVAVSGHDSLGRRFHAAHLDTAFRPSRYDLTKINRIRSGIRYLQALQIWPHQDQQDQVRHPVPSGPPDMTSPRSTESGQRSAASNNYCRAACFYSCPSLSVLRKSSRNQGFSFYFCLVIEGSGVGSESGSIPLTNGSGSRRLKNMWIRWIRIRNTALFSDLFYYR